MGHLRLSKLHSSDILRLKYQSRRFELTLSCLNDEIRDCANHLGLTVEGLRNAINLFQTKGIKSFNVQEIPAASEIEAWSALESVYPGIDKDYLYCLLSAGADTTGPVPLIVCSGPSGAGKSGTVHIAAKLLGLGVKEDVWTNSPHYSSRIARSGNIVSFLLFDEFTKFRSEKGSLLDSSLLLTRSILPACAGCVFTDVRIPIELTKIRQITRRTRFLRLTQSVNWPSPVDVLKLCPIAVNLVPHAIKIPWKESQIDFTELVELLNSIRKAPALIPPFCHRCIGKGWKLIDFESESPLTLAWRRISDECIGGDRMESMKLAEVNLSQIIGTETTIDKKRDAAYNNIMYIRVVQKVNGELRYD